MVINWRISWKVSLILSFLIFILISSLSFAGNENTYRQLKIFADVIDEINKNYVDPIESDKLVEKAISGMVQSLDPHSSFLTPDAYKELQDDTKGEFSGVGIVISMRNNKLTVVSPIEGTPAFRAGIQPGDVIYKVDGVSTHEMTLEEAVDKIKGPKGSSLSITLIRKGVTEPVEIKLVREEIPLESVKYITLMDGYGYTIITNFNEKTPFDFNSALKKLISKNKELKGLVLDLRGNPGGLLDESVQVADFFLDEGVIVSTKGRSRNHNQVWNAHKDLVPYKFPIVVLINGGSASASEIVAGALQDHKRALILGTTSFGKGSVQSIKPLKQGYALKYTIARYYTPNGKSIQARGIAPDIYLKFRLNKSEEDEKKSQFSIKEKDLKNHLEAEPGGKKQEEVTEKDNEENSVNQKKYGALRKKSLLMDNQIERALQILISQDFFKNS